MLLAFARQIEKLLPPNILIFFLATPGAEHCALIEKKCLPSRLCLKLKDVYFVQAKEAWN